MDRDAGGHYGIAGCVASVYLNRPRGRPGPKPPCTTSITDACHDRRRLRKASKSSARRPSLCVGLSESSLAGDSSAPPDFWTEPCSKRVSTIGRIASLHHLQQGNQASGRGPQVEGRQLPIPGQIENQRAAADACFPGFQYGMDQVPGTGLRAQPGQQARQGPLQYTARCFRNHLLRQGTRCRPGAAHGQQPVHFLLVALSAHRFFHQVLVTRNLQLVVDHGPEAGQIAQDFQQE